MTNKVNIRELIREDYKFFIIFIMLGAVMYWTAIVVAPTLSLTEQNKQILDANTKLNKLIIDQNQEIIDNQNKNANVTLAVFNHTAQLRSQSTAEFEAIITEISNQIDNQTMLLEEIIGKHANTSKNEAADLLSIINNTYAIVIPYIANSTSVLPALNQSLQEHRSQSEGGFIRPIGVYFIGSTIEEMQQKAEELANTTTPNATTNYAIDILSGMQTAPGPESLAGQIAGARDFGIQVINQTNNNNTNTNTNTTR